MANFNTLIGGSAAAQRLIDNSREAGAIFPEATWDQIGQDPKLTNYLHQSLDPNGNKYGGDSAQLKEDILNTITTKGSSAILSLIDWGTASGESQQYKQFQNLLGRVYEQAPNRLLSGNLNDTAQALGSGLLGAAVYDAPALLAMAPLKIAAGVGNLAMKAVGKTALEKAGSTLLAQPGQEALEAAGRGLVKDMGWGSAKISAKENAIEEAILGGVGDLGQQNAAMNRGLQEDEYSLTQAGMNTLGGAAVGAGLGGLVGGATGVLAGRQVVGSGAIQGEALTQKLDTMEAQYNADQKLKAGQEQQVDPGFVSTADAWLASTGKVASATDTVNQFKNVVTAGYTTSRYTPEQLEAIKNALTDFRGSSELSESLKAQANTLRAQGTPAAIQQALALEQQATGYESVVKFLQPLDLDEADALMVNGDISPDLVRRLTALDANLAQALAPVQPPAAKGARAPAAATTMPPAAPAAPANTSAAASAQVAPVATGAEPAVSPINSTPAASAAPAPVTAAEIGTMAQSSFSAPEKQSYDTLTEMLAVAGTDLQTVLDKVATSSIDEAAATIVQSAPDVGLDRGAVQGALRSVTAAAQKQVSAREAAPTSEMPPEYKAIKEFLAAVDQGGVPLNPAVANNLGRSVGLDISKNAKPEEVIARLREAMGRFDESSTSETSAPGATNAPESTATEAELTAKVEVLTEQVTELAGEAASSTASLDYAKTMYEMQGQRESAVQVLDNALADISAEFQKNLDAYKGDKAEAKLSADEKAGIVQAALNKAMEANPDLAPLFAHLDAKKMTNAKGVAAAKAKLETLANQAIDYAYAKIVADVLPDPTNVADFESVIGAMLSGVPTDHRVRMVESYRAMVHTALMDRIAAVGIKNVMADKVLGPAWLRLVGGFDPIKNKDVTYMVNDIVMEKVAGFSAMSVNPVSGEMISKATGVVRDFMNQLKLSLSESGVALDERFMKQALEMKAVQALDDELNGKFRTENKEAFDKIAEINALKARDASGNIYTRSSAQERNPFYNSMAGNPVLQRVEQGLDEFGDMRYKDMIVTGHKLEAGVNGVKQVTKNPQSILSDGISDYLGLLWSHPRKMFGAINMARGSILGAAINASADSLGSMVINGKKFSGSMKHLRGIYMENANLRAAQSRFALILDAVERRHMEVGTERYLNDAAYKERMARIAELKGGVANADIEVAEMMISHKRIADSGLLTIQRDMQQVLADAKTMGESSAEKIMALMAKLEIVKARNDGNLLNGLKGYTNKAMDEIGSGGKSKKSGPGGAEKGTAAYSASVSADGKFTPASTDVTAAVTLKFASKGNQLSKLFVPSEHITLAQSGDVLLFGEKIGTWAPSQETPKSPIKAKLSVKGMEGEVINTLASMSRTSLVKNHQALFDKHINLLPDGGAVSKAGDQVDVDATNIKEQVEAVAELKGEGKPKPSQLDTPLNGFDLPVDAATGLTTHVIGIMDTSSGWIHKPGKTQQELTVAEFAKVVHVDPKNVKLMVVPSGKLKANGQMVNETSQGALKRLATSYGDTSVKADSALAAAIAAKTPGVAPALLKARREAISIVSAEKIEVKPGVSLAQVVNDFNAQTLGLQWSSVQTLEGLNNLIAGLTATAKTIESLAPHGVKLANASRRMSFHFLDQRLAGFSLAEKQASFDLLRRLDGAGLNNPYFYKGTGDQYNLTKNQIDLSPDAALDGAAPKHIAVTHEVGHWAFANLLTPSEKVDFVRSLAKYYTADGQLDVAAITKGMANVKAIEAATGKKVGDLQKNTNELFAWQFTNWYMDKAVGKAGESAEASLWQKVVKLGKNMLAHFMGQKVDKDLIPLFERILPATVSESRYNYGQLLDISTGKLVDPAALPRTDSKPAAFVHDIAQKIDALRGRLGQQILTPGGVTDVSFVEDLKAATNHMFGLLYGRDKGEFNPSSTVEGLRQKLNPYRKNTDGTSRKLDGAVDVTQLFSNSEIGKLMTEIRAVTPEGVADNVAFEAGASAEEFFAIIKDTTLSSNPEAMYQFKQTLTTEYTRLVKEGMSPDDALDAAELVALREAVADGVAPENALFNSDGSKLLLGDDAQRAALGSMSRKLYDLMSDALDHLDGELSSFGYHLMPNRSESVKIELTPEVEKEVAAKAAKISKAKPAVKPTVAPATEKAAEVTAREEADRAIDGVMEGVPAGAPDQIKLLIRGVPHRDGDQNSIIGTLAYRIFMHISGAEGKPITNADIAAITGVRLGKGVDRNALASTGLEAFQDSTAPFDALRTSLRTISEELTNKNRTPKEGLLLVSRVTSIGLGDVLNQRFLDGAFGADELAKIKGRGVAVPRIRDDLVAAAVWQRMNGVDAEDGLLRALTEELEVQDAANTALSYLAGLGKTPAAVAKLGDAVPATPGHMAPSRYTNGLLHPALARGIVEQRLAALTVNVRTDLLHWAYADVSETNLSPYIGFVREGEPLKVYTTVGDMLDATDEASAELASAIALARRNGDAKLVAELVTKAEAMDVPGVIPVLYKSGRVQDGNQLGHSMAKLKKQRVTGVLENGVATMVDATTVKPIDEMIAKANNVKRNRDATDVPLVGEVLLNLALDDATPFHPMALEQRALETGAPAEVASIFSGLFKKTWRKAEGPTEPQKAAIATFSGLQMRTNPSRILKAGGKWLADLIMPVEGTGFEQRLMTAMSSDLMPLTTGLDALTRPTGAISKHALNRTHWAGKAMSEIQRNADWRGHKVPQSEMEDEIVRAMRTNDLSKLSPEAAQYAQQLRKHFKALLIKQNEAGIPVGDVTDGTNPFYLPQRFNTAWIMANRDDAIQRLADYFTKDRGGNSSRSKLDATKVIDDAINREELQGMLDSSNTTYAQAFGEKLHSRQLKFDAGDWSAGGVGPLFDGNLRSLLTSYTEAAHKRMAWADSFGVRGHGVATYTDIALRGSDAVRSALMGKAQGMTKVDAKFDRNITDAEFIDAPGVEFTESLFSPMCMDEADATYVTTFLMENLEKDKSQDMQERLVNAMVDRFTKSGGQGSQHFKVRAAAIVNGLADFGDVGGKVGKQEVEFMLRTVGTLGGRPAYTITANQTARNVAGALKTFNSVTLLSGVVLSSLPDTVLPLIRSGQMGSWLKGTAKAVKLAASDPATAAAMQRIGVIMESILNENIGQVNGGRMGRVSNAFFNATLLTPWTNAMRQSAALVGFESIKANQVIVQREAAAGKIDSWKYRKAIRYLRQLGLAHLATAEKLDTFDMAVNDPRGATNDAIAGDNAKVAQAIHRFVSESVFQPNRSDIPLWAQDPIASIFWQFKSYPMMLGRLVRHNFKEAFVTEGGKYAGDPMGLLYLLSVGAGAGYGTLVAKDHLLGKNQEEEVGNWRSQRERSLSKMVQDFGFKDYQMDNGEADAFLGAYAQGLLSIGALGLLADLLYQSAKSVDNGAFGRERITSQILGPSMGAFGDALQMIEGGSHALTGDDESNAKERTAVRKVLKRIPVVGGQDPWVEAFVDTAAGESQQ